MKTTPAIRISERVGYSGLVRSGLVAWVFIGWLGLPSAIRGTNLDEVQARGKLIMGCVPHQESHFIKTRLEAGPMRRQGTEDHFQGVDVDVMSAFARFLGVSLEIRPAVGPSGVPSYTEAIAALRRGEVDVVASSLSITPERDELVDFSDPYHTTRPVIVVREDSTVSSLSDLSGKIASTLPGSSQQEHLKSTGFPESSMRHVEFMLENYASVQEGVVDFTVVDSGSAERVLPKYKGLKVAFALPQEDNYGIAVASGSDLLPHLNRFLKELRDSGELDRIITTHSTLTE